MPGLMIFQFWVTGNFVLGLIQQVCKHLAYYALWDRWDLSNESLSCYQKFLPVARKLGDQFGYKGAKWGKQIGRKGRAAPMGRASDKNAPGFPDDGSWVVKWEG